MNPVSNQVWDKMVSETRTQMKAQVNKHIFNQVWTQIVSQTPDRVRYLIHSRIGNDFHERNH